MTRIERIATLSVLLAGALAVDSSVVLASGGGNDIKGQAPLIFTAPPPMPSSQGQVEIEKDLSNGQQSFKVEVKNVIFGAYYGVSLENPAGSGWMTSIGTLLFQSGGKNEAELSFETKYGQPLPLGVSDVAMLSGRRLEVRDAGNGLTAYATVPPLGTSGGGGGGGSNHDANVKAPLNLPPSAPDADAFGTIDLESENNGTKETFEVEAYNLSFASIAFSLHLENPAGSGQLSWVAGLLPDGSGYEGKYEVDTSKGQALPFGVPNLAALAGRSLEIRDSAGLVYLTGIVPALGTSQALGIMPYGGGSPGNGGIVPSMASSTPAAIGSTVMMQVSGGIGGTMGVLLAGPAPDAASQGSVTVLVKPFLSSFAPIPVVLQGTPGVPGAGSLSLPIVIPANPGLAGTNLFLQIVTLDTAVPGGLSATNGMEISPF